MYDPLEFWESNATNWLKQKHDTLREWKKIQKYINPMWSVLELGCGNGRWATKFNHYTGCDISPTLLIDAQKRYPDKQFFHHDMRYPIPAGFDLIFTFTSWLHVPKSDIVSVKLPKTNYLFIEPYEKSRVEYCFKHDYEQLFGVKERERYNKLSIYTN